MTCKYHSCSEEVELLVVLILLLENSFVSDLFVCVEVLRLSQPNGVMSSSVS